jgi:hypothetical protein
VFAPVFNWPPFREQREKPASAIKEDDDLVRQSASQPSELAEAVRAAQGDPGEMKEAIAVAGVPMPPITMEPFFQHRQAVLPTGNPEAMKALVLPVSPRHQESSSSSVGVLGPASDLSTAICTTCLPF